MDKIKKTQKKETCPCERLTCQKQIILDYLKSVHTHPSAEAVYKEVKKKLPRISRATVYRILNNLKNKGKVQEICADVSHYDGEVSMHAHFICNNCQKIFDVPGQCNLIKKTKTKIGKINKCQIFFYGICKKCQ